MISRRAADVQSIQTDQRDCARRLNRILAGAELQQGDARVAQHHAHRVRIRVAVLQQHRTLAEEDAQPFADKAAGRAGHAVVRVVEAHVALDGHEVREAIFRSVTKKPKTLPACDSACVKRNRDARAVHVDAFVHRRAGRVDAEAGRRAHAHAARAHLELAGDDARDAGACAVLLQHQRALPVLDDAAVARQPADFRFATAMRMTRVLLGCRVSCSKRKSPFNTPAPFEIGTVML